MKRHWIIETATLAALWVTYDAAQAQSGNPTADENLNRFSVSYRLGFDVSARFQTVRPLSVLLKSIPETGHGIARDYVVSGPYESYVRTDVNNNQYIDPDTGQIIYATWNWGVSSLDQINSADRTVSMSAITEVSEGSFETQDSDVTHGLELVYNRQLGHFKRGTWGLEAAFAFDQVSLRDHGAANAYATRITDSFQLLGLAPDIFVVPPQGGFEAPPTGWPLLSDEPTPGSRTRVIETITQAAAGHYEFNADLFGFRLGPYAEFPLSRKFHFALNGGLALLIVDSRFSYQEDVALYPSLSSSGKGKDNDLLVGGYVAGRIQYFLSDNWDIFVGGQWQGMSQYRQNVGGKEAQLDVGGRVFFTAGIGFSF